MLFNKSNTVQKNWRMVKKGKFIAFGCSLFFATGLALTSPAQAADKVVESKSTVASGDASTPNSTVTGGATVSKVTEVPKEGVVSEKNAVSEKKPVLEKKDTAEKVETSEKDQEQKKAKVNKAHLESVLQQAKAQTLEGKTSTSIENLEKAIQEAQLLLAKENVTQQEIDGSVNSLTNAINNLKNETKVESIADKDRLSEKENNKKETSEDSKKSTESSDPKVAIKKEVSAEGTIKPTAKKAAVIESSTKPVKDEATSKAESAIPATNKPFSSNENTSPSVVNEKPVTTRVRSRRALSPGQERSMEGKDIKYVYKDRKATVNGGNPEERAKIEYRQLGDYEVVNGKTVPTDPSGQGRPVLEWTVTFNEANYDKPGGYWYFTIPKNVSDPYNFVTDYDGVYNNRYTWKNGDGAPGAEGKQFIDAGNKLEMRVKNSVGRDYNNVNGLSGVMADTKQVHVLQTSIYSQIRKFTVRYRTVVEDSSQPISYIAGVESTGNLPRYNWYAISGKYDKHLVSAVATPNVTPNLTNTSVNVPVQTVASTSNTLSGTGTPGATIKLYIDGQPQNIGNVTVDNNGNWTTGELPTALNNNQGDGTTLKPRQTVEVTQTVDGTESSRRTVPISVGVTTVEPSALTNNKDAIVAGQKEVTLKIPHDAGIAYFRYTNAAGETVEIPIKRNSISDPWVSQKADKATVKSYEKGKFEDTVVLNMLDKIAGTEVASISNVTDGGFSSVAGWQPRGVENQAPTITSAVEGNKKTVQQGAQLDLASLVTVADKEDDAQATLGDKVHAEVVSVNGSTATKTVDTNAPGTYTVKYKAVDSQGKTSDEIEVTVVVNAARENVAPTVEIPYSDPTPDKKEIYLYTGEEADVDITFNDDSGKIKSAALKQGGNRPLSAVDGNPDKQDNQFGYTVTAINSETATPAKIKVTGQVSGIAAEKLPKTEDDSLDLVTRFATATDTDGAEISNNATKYVSGTKIITESYKTDPGAVTFVLKAQTKKYDIKTPASADKVTVSNANNVTDEEFEKIKEKVKVEYSQNNPDARLADKKGTEVEDTSKVVDKVEKEGNNVVVTYKDGSKDTKPLSEFVNVAPKVELPYSNEANKQIYVYTGENTDLTFKATDNTAVKDMYVRGPGGIGKDNTADYGFTTGKIENSAVTHGDGTVSGATATIKMTGVTTLTAPNRWTSFVVANDNDNAPSNTDFNALDKNPNATQTPGYVQFIVKSQTDKYDIKTPTEKVEVANPANVTEDDLAKIKEKLQIEYAQTNDDANFADKKGTAVDAEDAKPKIRSVEKDNAGNLVVTYTDGSTDKKSLSEFVTRAAKDADGIKDPAKTPVADPANLTQAEKDAVKKAIEDANPGKVANVVVGNDGAATVTFKDGSEATLTPDKTVAKAKDADGIKDPAKTEDKVVLGEKAKGILPNTGLNTSESALLGFSALLAGIALAVRKRKEEE